MSRVPWNFGGGPGGRITPGERFRPGQIPLAATPTLRQ
nr:hypothetical protein JVH1_0711 [Rhodococcus sp. JVH1]